MPPIERPVGAAAAAPRKAGQRGAKIGAVVFVVAGFAIAHAMGALDPLKQPAALAQKLVDLGGWGYVAFVMSYALLQPFGVPGTVFILAAPLIWPWPTAFALSMAGTMAASVIGFSFVRFVARDWVASRVPERFRKYDEALGRRAFMTVFALRFIFWMPQPLHAFFGVSKVRFWTHFWGSFAGYLVPLFLVSYFGQRLFDLLKTLPPSVWITVAIGVAVAIAVAIVLRSRRTHSHAASPRDPVDAA